MYRVLFFSVLTILQSAFYVIGTESESGCKAADVVFVLDSSRSIWIKDFKTQLKFVEGVVSTFNIDSTDSATTRVGIITYGQNTSPIFSLNRYKDIDSMKRAIKNIKHRNGITTNTGGAIDYMNNNMFSAYGGSRSNVAHIGIVITDGKSQELKKTLKAAEDARANGIEMYAIGVGSRVNYDELVGIASSPESSHVYAVDSYDALLERTHIFAADACRVTTESYTTTVPTTTEPITTTTTPSTTTTEATTTTTTPTTTTTEATTTTTTPTTTTTETTTTTVAPTVPTTSIKTIIDDQGAQPENDTCIGKPADIYFLMDSSASIGDFNFNLQKQFVKNMVSRFDISQDNTRVGIVTFSNAYNVNVPLGSANTNHTLNNAIDSIPYMYGMTNTAYAIRYVRQFGFKGVNKREGVAQIVIVLTDGKSREPQLTKEEAALARDAGVYLFAIGIGNRADMQELKAIASEPHANHVFHVSGFGALDSIKDILASRTCDTGPIAKLCGTHDLSDIIFLYDALGIGAHKTNIVSKFVAKVVQNLDTRSGNVRIGRMLYDCLDDAYTALTSPEDIHVWGNTVLPDIVDLLRKLRVSGFTPARGGRSNAKSVAVMFLDGEIHNLQDVQKHMSIMSNVQFITVMIGRNDINTSGFHNILKVPTYDNLLNYKQELLGHLCPEKNIININLTGKKVTIGR